MEERTTGFAHQIFVNSKFTQNAFYTAFRSLKNKKTEVLYPCVDVEQFRSFSGKHENYFSEMRSHMSENTVLVTSLNRYERKKNVRLVL